MVRFLYHISFWVFFILLFVYQNPKADLQEYLSWVIILGVSALVVYVNLYWLLVKYFFEKRYLIYFPLLVLLIILGGFLLDLIVPLFNEKIEVSFFQDCINLLFFVIITSSGKFFREFLREQERLIKSENEQLKTELSLLKSQVHPHFLLNTLSNLYGLIIQSQNDQAADVTLKLSGLLRYLLQSSKREDVKLTQEVAFLEDYLMLEKIRLTQDADIQFQVTGLNEDILIAPLLFIPVVENVFKHGLNSLSKDSFAHFSLAVQGNELLFEAQNSIGLNINDQPKSGLGLENLKKRLDLVYPDKHFLEIEKQENIFKVTLHLNL
jgi:sensor histidine kinase YesM